MNLTPQTLQQLQVIYNAQFQESYEQTPTIWDRIASRIPVDNAGQVVSGWLDRLPQFHEWTGDRQLGAAVPREWTTTIKDWEGTIEIDRNAILDDRLQVYLSLITMQAQQARKYPDILLKAALQSGASSPTWDGANFFAPSSSGHPVNLNQPSQGTQANLFTGMPLSFDTYAAGRASMASFLGADGQPLYVTPNVMLVPPQLEVTAKNLIHSDLVPVNSGSGVSPGGAATTTNTLKNTAEVVVMPELSTEPTVWYLFDASKPLRPLIFADRQAPQFQLILDPNDPSVFMRKKYLYGWDARGNIDYGLWFLAARFEG